MAFLPLSQSMRGLQIQDENLFQTSAENFQFPLTMMVSPFQQYQFDPSIYGRFQRPHVFAPQPNFYPMPYMNQTHQHLFRGRYEASRHPSRRAGVTGTPFCDTERIRESVNKPDFNCEQTTARFFVVKSYSEDDVHKSIKHGLWASTPGGNERLKSAWDEHHEKGPIFLFFSVNSSQQFCGVARMTSEVKPQSLRFWKKEDIQGHFSVEWVIIKDVSNKKLNHILLANNKDKPVTASRDIQEVLYEAAREMLEIMKSDTTETSILDDFTYYDDRERMLRRG